MRIGNREIGKHVKPFIIAEMSGNHNQSLSKALKLVEIAAKSGVDAIKLQTYTPDTITLNVKREEFTIRDKDNLWKDRTLYDLYSEAYTPWEWHNTIFEYANELGLIAFSSPFDETSVDFLEMLNVPAYKIASFENIHHPLIKKVAATGKPIIISTGMATVAELDDVRRVVQSQGNDQLIFLKCTSTYPTSPADTNLATVPHMRELFDMEIGLSDHTLGIGASVAAVALGATVIEKHFTDSRDEGGVDAAFSLEPNELASLVQETETAWLSIGNIKYGPTIEEEKSLKRRRSIYFSENLKAGEVLSNENIRVIRPGLGLPPKYYEILLGKTVKVNVFKGEPVDWEKVL